MTEVELAQTSPMSSSSDELATKIQSIPDKMGFKIGEAADYVGVKQYVLRYWETEFDILKPRKSANGQRVYTPKDLEVALVIRKLLHRDRFSIEGAKAVFSRLQTNGEDLIALHGVQLKQRHTKVENPKSEKRMSVKQLETTLQKAEEDFMVRVLPQIEELKSRIQIARKRLKVKSLKT